jgi:hypothetical protein
MTRAIDGRMKEVAVGTAVLATLTATGCGLLLGWRFLPGVVGEWFGTMLGIAATPFFLEASVAVLGLTVVIALNIWRRHKEGDEFVILEQVSGPNVPADLPEHARWAIYRGKHAETAVVPTALDLAEGALAIEDFEAVAGHLEALSASELAAAPALRVRLEFAQKTGHAELAETLAAQLRRTEGNAAPTTR